MADLIRSIQFAAYLRIANALLDYPGHCFRILVLKRLCRFDVGPRTTVERGVRITTRGLVSIGAGCNVNAGALLDGRGGLVIGNHVNISPDVMLLTADHDCDSPDFAGSTAPIIIGDRSWLASRALVLPGVVIGEGAVVGAGSVVTSAVPSWTVVAGVPARVIKTRDRRAQRTLRPYRRWFH